METVKLYPVCAYVAGLAITLFLASYLTPPSWWRRPNARALLVMVLGTWGLGSLMLHAVQGQPATAAAVAEVAVMPLQAWSDPTAGQPFKVHRDLNLRRAAGVDAARLVIVPAGATVTPTGVRDGDWWQIRASVAGRDNTGWASSLWLRRSGE